MKRALSYLAGLLVVVVVGLAQAQQVSLPNGGTTSSGSTINPGSLTCPAGSPCTIGQYGINGQINVQQPPYNASGSNNTYTASITTNTQTLIATASTDFQVGQYVAIPTAGAATTVVAISAPSSIGNLGTSGAVNDCYTIVVADADEGMLAPTNVTCNASGPAAGAFTSLSGLQVNFTASGGSNAIYGIYRQIASGQTSGQAPSGTYTFVNVVTGTPYKDYGQDLPKTWDWPATVNAGAQTDTAFCKVLAVSTTTNANDTLKVDCTSNTGQAVATTTATAVTIRHDDTIAVQAAWDAAAGKQLYFPAGTYHLNEIVFSSNVGVIGYGPSTGTASGSILARQTKVSAIGAGVDKTIITQDFAVANNGRGALFTLAPNGIFPFSGPQQSSNAARYTNYAFNSAIRGATSITTTSAGDAGNFSAGDVAYFTGGVAVDGSYTISNMSKVVSANATTGVIKLQDPITSDLPYGSGIANFISDLTTNAAVLETISFQDMTLSTPNSPFNPNSVYGLTINNVRIPETEQYTAGLFAGQWIAKLNVQNSEISSNTTQVTVDSYVNFSTNNHMRIPVPYGSFSFKGGTNTTVEGSEWGLFCGSGIVLQGSMPTVTFEKNVVAEACPVNGSSADSPTITLNYVATSLANAYNWLIQNNSITSSAFYELGTNNGNAGPPNTIISNNAINHVGQTGVATQSVLLYGPVKFIGNRIYTTSPGNTGGFIMNLGTPTAAGGALTDIENNDFVQSGTDNRIGLQITDPGSAVTNILKVQNNRFVNVSTGIYMPGSGNPTNLPNAQFWNNSFDGVTAPYNPAASFNYQTECNHGLAPASVVTINTCGTIAANTPATGTDCNGRMTTGTTATSCAITFATAYKQAPNCICEDETTGADFTKCISSTTQVTFTTASNTGDVLKWQCRGN